MAYRIAINTRFAGSPKGTFLDDLTSASVGQLTSTPAVKNITKIVVYAGWIIDSVRITYEVENAPTPITVQHGGPGGAEALSFEIGANDKLLAVYGARLVGPGPWGERDFSQLSFIVINSSENAPTTRVYTATGSHHTPTDTEKFEISWPLTTASSYTFQPQGAKYGVLQGLGFSDVSYKADSQVF